MPDSHHKHSDDNERALKSHEAGLVVGKMAVETFPELGNTIDGTDEDADSGSEKTLEYVSSAQIKKKRRDCTYSTETA